MKRTFIIAGVVCGLVVGMIGVLPLLAQTPTPPPSRLDHDRGLIDLPRYPQAAVPMSSDHTPLSPNDMAAWSKLTYQSYVGNWDIFAANGDGSNRVRLTSSGAPDITPRFNRGATRVVFASSEPGNYEIFAMNANGSNRVRLTNQAANDYNPAWSPDGSKIVFNSYRDGQSEIYVMNADGSNPVRLTNAAGYDGQSVWSPDGTKIAFLSDRSGGSQIWIMNANGSGATQLTTQPYSEDPAWSPDGTKIAYDADSDGDGWQELMVVNANGTNPHVIGDTGTAADADMWARSWSPDGRSVAFTIISYIYYQGNWYWTSAYSFAADTVAGGAYSLGGSDTDWFPDWQTTDLLPPTSSMTALPATSPSPIVVRWNGTDAGPSAILGYDVQVKDGAGAWTMWLTRTAQTSASYPGIGGHTYSFRVRAVDNSNNAQAWPASAQASTTVEALPPVSTLSPLPAYHRGELPVSWSGSDAGGSGIGSYDVQYRDGITGTWTGWLNNTGLTTAAFTGEAGHAYSFRVRATDQAQNQENWSSGPFSSTTFYVWQITGLVSDGRDRRVVDAAIELSPPGLTPITSTASGYQGYLSVSGVNTLTVSQSGWGSTPPMSVMIDRDVKVNHWLPPLDDVIQNGGFEAPAWPESWLTFGSPQPSLSSDDPHSGHASVRLGRASGAIDPQDIMSGQGYHTAVDQQGTIYVVGLTSFDSPNYLYAAKPLTATAFTLPMPITLSVPGMIDKPLKFMPDNNGGLYGIVIRSENNQRYLAACHKLAVATVCGDFRNLIALDANGIGSPLSIVIDQYGGWHLAWIASSIAWIASSIYYGYVAPGSNLGSFVTIPGSTGGDLSGVSLAVDQALGIHLAWSRQYYVQETWYADVMYSTRPPSGTWTAPARVALSQSVSRVDLVSGEDDTLHLSYTSQGYGTYYSFKPHNQNWATPTYVPDSNNAFASVLRIDQQDRPHVAIMAGPSIRYLMLGSDHEWRHLFNVSAPSFSNLQAQLDPAGLMHIFWQPTQISPPFALSYTRLDTAPADSDVGLMQTVTVSDTAHRPTLSLLYKPADQLETNNALSVTVDDGITPSNVLSIAPSALGWSHAWADLSFWRGQIITLTINWHQSMGMPYSAVYLDEVSLGSWLTPDPQTITPNRIEANASTVIAITGDNFIDPPQVRLNDVPLPDAHWVNTNTITATVPALLNGRYDVIVINPGGQASGVPYGLTVGRLAFLPMLLK
jgi:Tol biopolymer transport system component